MELLPLFDSDAQMCVVVLAACVRRVHQAGHANPATYPRWIRTLAQLGEAGLPNVDLHDTAAPVSKVDKYVLAVTASREVDLHVCNLPDQFHAVANMAGSKSKVESIDDRERARVRLPGDA